MPAANDAVIVLNRALDQMGDLVAAVREDQLSNATPCDEWRVQQLLAHVLAVPQRFLQMAHGEEVDWDITPTPPETGWAEAFREDADDLIHHWHQQPDEATAGADWHTAEFAVHAYDLARAIGRATDKLDPEPAERGLAFMQGALTAEMRGNAFGPEQPAPDGADPYERLAAYAGRTVG